jgi:hypothetical protein
MRSDLERSCRIIAEFTVTRAPGRPGHGYEDNIKMYLQEIVQGRSGVPVGLGVQPPIPPKFQSFDKAEPNSQFRGKYFRNNLITIQISVICR